MSQSPWFIGALSLELWSFRNCGSLVLVFVQTRTLLRHCWKWKQIVQMLSYVVHIWGFLPSDFVQNIGFLGSLTCRGISLGQIRSKRELVGTFYSTMSGNSYKKSWHWINLQSIFLMEKESWRTYHLMFG